MLIGCGIMILVLVVFKDRLTEGWLFALVIGACVIPHLFMMRGHKKGHEHGGDTQDTTATAVQSAMPTTEEKPTNHKGGCCH